MKILLAAVNAKYIHSNLAVYSLRAAARSCAEQIEIGEYTINQQSDQILSDIYKRQPEVVAFSCYIWNRRVVGDLLRELPKVLPGVQLWAGGPEVSYDAADFLREFPQVSGVLCGEGEGIFSELAAYYIEGKGALSEIDGLVWRDGDGQIHENPPAAPLDLDELPFAYGDLKGFEHRIIYYESSRGCPFRCSYCLSSLEKRVRFRSLERVKRELSVFLEAKVPQVKFVDRTFNCAPERTRELLAWILEHDNGVTNFHFEIAADLLTEEELEIMSRMRPGLIQLEIGVQSVNPQTITMIERTTDLKRLSSAVARLKRSGNIHRHLDLIAGLPGEDLESFQNSFDAVFAMEPEQLQLGFLKVLKGSKMRQDAEKYGLSYHREPPYEVLSTAWMDYGDILLLKGVEEMVEVYYNSCQFERTLEILLKKYRSPFAFFHELADYYEENGYAKVSHSRMARYEILREFADAKGFSGADLDAGMLFDLYARENLKSRPAFAPDLAPYRDVLKKYTKDAGHQVHVEVFPGENGPQFVRFDYRRRDPLTGRAYVEVLKTE